ncbi:MAG: chloride channel protein, partial [gamma proteobacterium symbiont of Taylorina sp.]|nr:chloride channel protein [gamma proteobacterium symbiont of Taylorina sp.]
ALTAIMELSQNPQVILPGMIAIVVANLTASELFRKKSLFISMLEFNGIDISSNPVTQSLRRTGVAGMMNKSIIQTELLINAEKLEHLISNDSKWLLIENNNGEFDQLIPMNDLVKLSEQDKEFQADELIDLNVLLDSHNKNHISVASIHLQATLEEALEKMKQLNLQALYVKRVIAPGITRIYGIVTREQIEASYHP